MVTPSRLRRNSLSVTLWGFGFATTLLLIGLWGRSTSTDERTIAESSTAIVTSDLVRDRVADWVEDGFADAGLAMATPVGDAVDRILAIEEVRAVLDGLIAESVAALVANDETAPQIDVAVALAPASPLIAAELGLDETIVREAIARVKPIDLSASDAARISDTADAVHGALTLAAVLAAVAMAMFGTASVVLSDDRRTMVRGLAIRVALSAFSFALLFQIGGWLIDPNGGRSPLLTGSSILIRSNGHVFIVATLIATAVAAAVTVLRSRGRAGDRSADQDDTRELVPSGAT